MNSYDYIDTETYDSDADGESWGDSSVFENWDSEDWEAKRGRSRPRPVPTAKGANTFKPRPGTGAGGPVTQAQLEAALARVRQEVRANAAGIKALDGRVRTVSVDQQRFEGQARRRIDGLQSELKTTQTLNAFIPLIAKPGTKLGSIAPLAYLFVPEMSRSSTAGGAGAGPLGNNALVAAGALLFASGALS